MLINLQFNVKLSQLVVLQIAFMILQCQFNELYCQTDATRLKKLDTYYCLSWIHEFEDSIILVVNHQQIPISVAYSEVDQKHFLKTDYCCWTGLIGLESPVELKEKLRVSYRKNRVIFRLGGVKKVYIIEWIKPGWALLIRE